jgi:protein-S-isoprenylcysteine O-methyltransferase Ste14
VRPWRFVGPWARYYLGKNWGMPMTVKEDPELVTGGPYTFVRHPIYTGILLAVLGSVLASSLLWLVILVFFTYEFIRSVKGEEMLMTKQFPEKYPAYKKRTKMLIPFVY